jgi:hypothetical protein
MPPMGGKSLSMALNMVVAGVMGYPAKKRHPAATAPQAIASFPSMRQNPIFSPIVKFRVFNFPQRQYSGAGRKDFKGKIIR